MTETINWQALPELQRDELIHTAVMGHSPDEPCTGQFTPLDPEPDGLGCPTCGAEITWGDLKDADEMHGKPRPPHYTTSMDAAWQIVEHLRTVGRATLMSDFADALAYRGYLCSCTQGCWLSH
jgi:hypothetical protein